VITSLLFDAPSAAIAGARLLAGTGSPEPVDAAR
jgi:hypothetical protein